MIKNKYYFRHSQKRAKERYNLDLTEEKYTKLCKLIRLNKGIFIKKRSHRFSNWIVKYNNKSFFVGYNPKQKQIVTFLPYLQRKIGINDEIFK